MTRLQAPAKINLRIKVLGTRPDGYHELDMLLVPINIYDALEVNRSDRLKITCNWPGLATDESNTIVKALRWWSTKTGRPMEPLAIDLKKTIPMQAGLGGGSSDAGILLKWLAAENNIEFDAKSLEEIGRTVGADVPFFVAGGLVQAARVCGLGERVEPIHSIPLLHLIVIKPPVAVSTPWAFQEFDRHIPPFAKGGRGGIFSLKTLEDLIGILENDLEPVVELRYPDILEAKQALLENGAQWAMMTGSGSAVFGIYRTVQQRDQAVGKIRSLNDSWQVFPAESLQIPSGTG